jgi:hypothetical protein
MRGGGGRGSADQVAGERQGPPFHGVEWDDALEQDPRATAELIKGHERVERWLRHRAGDTTLRLSVLTGFHRVMFAGVFPDLAGR